MPLAKSLQQLPPSAKKDGGSLPTSSPILVPALVDYLDKKFSADDNREMATDTARIRHSWAGSCSRSLAYRLQGLVEAPPAASDRWRFALGRIVHELFEEAVLGLYPDAEIEAKLPLNELSAGHADGIVVIDGVRCLLELKTINGFGFKKAIGLQGQAEGPRSSAILQASVNALAADCEKVLIVYLSLECISAGIAKKHGFTEQQRFSAEWIYDREEWLPLATEEVARWTEVTSIVDGGDLPPRHIPDHELPKGAEVYDPAQGRWEVRELGQVVDAGKTWHCGYCPFQEKCIQDLEAGQ